MFPNAICPDLLPFMGQFRKAGLRGIDIHPDNSELTCDLCGPRTADNITENTHGESVGNVGVPLIRPEKVRGLPKWRQIIVIDALDNPIKAKLVPYFKRKRWNEVADKNPYRKR